MCSAWFRQTRQQYRRSFLLLTFDWVEMASDSPQQVKLVLALLQILGEFLCDLL